jgi:hypothetical protein
MANGFAPSVATLANNPIGFAMSMKAAVQQIGQHANMMPLERGITLPMVKLENKRVIVRRLIYFARATPQHGTAITQLQYVASDDLSNAAFIGLEKFESEFEVVMTSH